MPMNFTVSAPGKVILNGEHSVVYGKAALAGVVELRNHITLTSHSHESLVILLDIFGKNALTIPLNSFNTFLTTAQTVLKGNLLPDDIDHDQYLSIVTDYVNTCENVTQTNVEAYEKTLSSIFYLLAAILTTNSDDSSSIVALTEGFQLKFESDITMGAGLGSSASFGVCVAGAFYFYSKLCKDPNYVEFFNKTAEADQRNEILTKISSWAFCSERIMHGTPSGLDNAICTFGNVFKFYKGAKPITIKPKISLNILLVDTRVSRSTAKVVKKVADLKGEYGELIGHIMDAMGSLVEDVVLILENRQSLSEAENYEKLKRLFTINNNLLRAIGVSHPALEKIFATSDKYGFSCKLTGAGAGGYAIVLLPPAFQDEPNYAALCEDLQNEAFHLRATTIGGSGFQIQS